MRRLLPSLGARPARLKSLRNALLGPGFGLGSGRQRGLGAVPGTATCYHVGVTHRTGAGLPKLRLTARDNHGASARRAWSANVAWAAAEHGFFSYPFNQASRSARSYGGRVSNECLYQHVKRPEWGMSTIISLQDDRTTFLFVDGMQRTFKRAHLHMMELVTVIDEASEELDREEEGAGQEEGAQGSQGPGGPCPELATVVERQLASLEHVADAGRIDALVHPVDVERSSVQDELVSGQRADRQGERVRLW